MYSRHVHYHPLCISALTAPIHHSTTPSVAVNKRPHQLTSMLLEERIREAEDKLKQESDNHKDTIQQLQAETSKPTVNDIMYGFDLWYSPTSEQRININDYCFSDVDLFLEDQMY